MIPLFSEFLRTLIAGAKANPAWTVTLLLIGFSGILAAIKGLEN